MLQSAFFLLLHFAFCTAWFMLLQRPLFMIYTRKSSPEPVNRREVASAFRNGFSTDCIAAAYLTGFPFLVLWAHIHLGFFALRPVLMVCEGLVALVLSLITISDTALYPFWKFKIDSSALAYLRSLKGTFASVSPLYSIAALSTVLLLAGGAWVALMALAGASGVEAHTPVSGWWHVGAFLLFVLMGGIDFAVIRGIEHRPNTPCMVYRSPNMWINHSAINPLYNFIYSFSVNDKATDVFNFMDQAECDKAVDSLYPRTGEPTRRLLRTQRPNILFIVWESLSSRFVETLGGKPGVMPRFEELAREGVLFTNVEANSFRTDRGLVCLLSGYLGQPTMSLIRDTRKLPKLPAVPRRLRELGYTTEAVHGGDLKIMHKNDYYMTSGITRLKGIETFPPEAPRCSWGVHDHYVADYVADEAMKLQAEGKPWMLIWQTLSSHQPFKVPFNRLDNPIHNAFAYADDAFGQLVDKLKAAPGGLWDNLLIVAIGDHGLNNTDEPLSRNDYVRIPLLLLGGAVKEPARIDTLMAQTDLASTLLGQLGLSHDEFRFSRDVLAPTYKVPFTFHAYNNGFLLHDLHGFTDYDNAAERTAASAGDDPLQRELTGRMILQSLYADIRSL